MINAVAFNDASFFVNEEWIGDTVSFGVSAQFTGPLASDSDGCGGVCCVIVNMLLNRCQLAAAIWSPSAPKERQDDVLFPLIGYEGDLLPPM